MILFAKKKNKFENISNFLFIVSLLLEFKEFLCIFRSYCSNILGTEEGNGNSEKHFF